VDHSFGYLDKENVITWNSKYALTYGILADLVTYRIQNETYNILGRWNGKLVNIVYLTALYTANWAR